jgi:replicative DNA helicase
MQKTFETPTFSPHSKESEMMVLGCMLSSANALNIASDQLVKDDFYLVEHSMIFDALKRCYLADRPADVHLVCEELKSSDNLEKVGGTGYVTTLAQYAGTAAYVEEYADLVRKKALLRKMIQASQQIEKKSLKSNDDVHSILDEAQSLFFQISQRATTKLGVTVKDYLIGSHVKEGSPFLKELQKKQEEFSLKDKDAPAITGIPCGFVDLDKIMSGLNEANLIILAARPSMGKTGLMLNMADHVAFEMDVPVAFFSLEMTAAELVMRLITSRAEVETDKIRTGSLTGHDYQKVVEAVNCMQEHQFIIDDQPGLTITDLCSKARRLKEVYNIGFIVVDYLQLISGSRGSYGPDNRQNEISEISRMLKSLARELNIPILCGSQLSRKVEERAGHRPMLSDLRESGSIEQDADIVQFIFRREYYNPQDKPGIAEIIIAKNRHGSIGSVELSFRKELVQFNSLTAMDEFDEDDNAFDAFNPK